jgi:hypothetical protein
MEESLLASIAAFKLKDFLKCWEAVKPLFYEQDRRLFHWKVDERRPELERWHEQKRNAGVKSGAARRSKKRTDVERPFNRRMNGRSNENAILFEPSASASASASSSVAVPPSPQPILPTEGEPAYWVDRLLEIHPSPCEPRFPWLFCENHLNRLGGDPDKFAGFMAEVHRGLLSWAAHWSIDGNRFARPLEKWLDAGGWKKKPPVIVQPAKPTGRYELLEDDNAAH